MLAKLIKCSEVKSNWIDYADVVADSRPPANDLFDQVYMFATDMVNQANLVQDYIADKNVVFLGDGDGMAMLLGLLSVNSEIEPPKSMSVLDFDQRIVNNIQRISGQYLFNESVEFDAQIYNVIDPIPSQFESRFDFFYFNPPYGSKNAGISTDVWFYRCMDLCEENTSGCIIVPYDERYKWTQAAMTHIQELLIRHGFIIRDMVSDFHRYHRIKTPDLRSAALIVQRCEYHESPYKSQSLPYEILINLYGSPRKIPRHILDDGSIYGCADYSWQYGQDFWK